MNSLKFINILISLWLILSFSACQKNDTPYYDYVNDIQSFDGTALAYLQGQPQGTFDSLLFVLDRLPHIKDSLATQEVTLFAPVNESFAAAIKYLNVKREREDKEPLYLGSVDLAQLDTILCKYILRDKRETSDYQESSDGVLLESIAFSYTMHVGYEKMSSSGFQGGGASILNFSDTFGSTFTKDWVTTKANTVNIKTHNAIINILEPIHNFGFDEFTTRLDN